MPFIKLTGAHATLTGNLAQFAFKDGVSVENVSRADAERLGSSMRVYDAETGEQISKIHRMTAGRSLGFIPKEQSEQPQSEPVVEKAIKESVQVAPELNYTREQLEAIADEGGLKGLRDFAEPYGVRGKSIVGIIDELMLKVDK